MPTTLLAQKIVGLVQPCEAVGQLHSRRRHARAQPPCAWRDQVAPGDALPLEPPAPAAAASPLASSDAGSAASSEGGSTSADEQGTSGGAPALSEAEGGAASAEAPGGAAGASDAVPPADVTVDPAPEPAPDHQVCASFHLRSRPAPRSLPGWAAVWTAGGCRTFGGTRSRPVAGRRASIDASCRLGRYVCRISKDCVHAEIWRTWSAGALRSSDLGGAGREAATGPVRHTAFHIIDGGLGAPGR
jgi:hypothetical protein